MNVTEIVKQIEKQAESHSNAPKSVNLEIGDICRQGDIYIQRVDDTYAKGKQIADTQLAPGTSKGSRHVVEGAKVYSPETSDILHGPVIVAEQAFVVTHPEHPDYTFGPGTYRVGYQLDAKTRERVAD
jgi:hypothetical protein